MGRHGVEGRHAGRMKVFELKKNNRTTSNYIGDYGTNHKIYSTIYDFKMLSRLAKLKLDLSRLHSPSSAYSSLTHKRISIGNGERGYTYKPTGVLYIILYIHVGKNCFS